MQKINEIESYYNAISTFAIIAKTDVKGKIVEVNDKFCQISGYDRNELLGRDHRILNSGHHDKAFFKEMWATILSGQPWRGEIKNKAKQGHFYWVDTMITPVKNDKGEVVELISIRFEITEKKELEQSLKKSNENSLRQLQFLDSIRNNASHAIISGDVDGTITSFNKRAEEILGYKAEEVVGKKTPSIWHDPQEVLQRSQEFSKKLGEKIEPGFDTFICHSRLGLKNEFEWTYIHKDGTRIPVLLTITSLTNSEGEITGFLGLSYDIREQKSLENQLKESNEYLNTALASGEIGVWDFCIKNNEVKFDKAWANSLGLGDENSTVEISKIESRIHPDDLEQCYADLQDYKDGQTAYYQNIHRVKNKTGDWVHVLDRGKFSQWDEKGEPIRMIGVQIDITETENVKRKLSLFHENSPFGFAFCDMKGQLLDVNQKYKDILGYSFEELEKLSYWDLTPKKYGDQEADQLKSLEETGRYGPYIKEYIHKDGHLIPVELNGFIVENYDGQKGIWSIVEDITEKQKIQDQLDKQTKLANHNAKLASVGTLAGGVAHEINNPLAIIKGFVGTLQMKAKKMNNMLSYDDIKSYIDKIDTASDRIAKIVKVLRSFSPIDIEEIKIFDVTEIMEVTLAVMGKTYKQQNVELKFKNNMPDDEKALIKGSPGKFQQSLMNIITNAFEAVNDRNEKEIVFSLSVNNNRVFISIEDNGVGIPMDIQNKVFDPFFTTKGVNQGAGVGLSLTHIFVKEMNGEVTLKSVEDEGTTVYLNFPMSQAA